MVRWVIFQLLCLMSPAYLTNSRPCNSKFSGVCYLVDYFNFLLHDVDGINEVKKLGNLYTILQTLWKGIFKDSALHLRVWQMCPRCEFGGSYVFCEIHFCSPVCVCLCYISHLPGVWGNRVLCRCCFHGLGNWRWSSDSFQGKTLESNLVIFLSLNLLS